MQRPVKRLRHGIEMPRVVVRNEAIVPCPPSGRNKTDIRHMNEYSNFNCTKFHFSINTDAPIPLGTHHDTPAMNIVLARDSMHQILGDALYYVKQHGFPDESIIHIFFKTRSLKYDFVFANAGEEAIRVGHLDDTDSAINKVVDKFEAMIQSNYQVVLDGSAKLIVYAFRPPQDEQTNWINFLGSGYRKGNHSGFGDHYRGVAIGATVREFLHECKSVVVIENNDHSCMARSLAVAQAYLDDPTGRQSRTKNMRYGDKNRNRVQKDAARYLCEASGVEFAKPCGYEECEKFANYMDLNINVFAFYYGKVQIMYHSLDRPDRPHVYLHYDLDHKHYDCITDINMFLRAIVNKNRVFCTKCRKIRYNGEHRCFKSKLNRPTYQIGSRITHYPPDYALDDENTDFTKESTYIQRYKKDATRKDDSKVFYLDLETYVQAFVKETNDMIEEWDEEVQKNKADMNELYYEPFKFTRRVFNDAYEYRQVVNWAEIQSADGSFTQTFENVRELSKFLRQPMMEDSIVIAHYGQGFDFQLLYEDMFASDSVVQGKLEDPLMKGAKIRKGYLYNGVQLVDSYCYMSNKLEAIPDMFGFEELAKGFFPHLFNRPEFWDYKGPIPDKEWYGLDEMSEKRRKKFIEWHNKMYCEGYYFDFKAEMKKYCNSDVDILRRGMQAFREQFLNLQDPQTGANLGDDPLNFITIASLAYDGIYRRHFLEEDTIAFVRRPTREKYSADSILWLNHLMEKESIFIQHGMNHGEKTITLRRDDGHGTKYEKKVDGFCERTNTVYEFQGCFYHGCPKCYEEDEFHPLKCDVFNRERDEMEESPKITYGQVYATTVRIEEDILAAGYNLVTMWECDFKKLKKSHNLKFPNDLEKFVMLNPRDGYFGGRTNAVKLYYECTGPERIHYIDVTSMYPTVMASSEFEYPVGHPEVRRGCDPSNPLLPLDELFGMMKCHVIPPKDLYHPVLPYRTKEGKVIFPLFPMTGTWVHYELQKAVSLGYVIDEIYEQHHFPNRSNQLFNGYINTFFEMKKSASMEGNTGLKNIAKLCLNSFYGKFGFNIGKQHQTKIIREYKDAWRLMNGKYTRCEVNIINQGVMIASFNPYDEYTEHEKSNVYTAATVTAAARLTLYKVLEKLQEKVLYFDTDSCIYVSPTGESLVPVVSSDSAELGDWTNELKDGDNFVMFASAGPKTYAAKSASGKNDICKAKGFTLSFKNHKILNFESLKLQILHKAFGGEFKDPEKGEGVEESKNDDRITKLVMHENETMMVRNKNFSINVIQNPGKQLNMVYDKRVIVRPECSMDSVKCIDTLPLTEAPK